MASTMTKTQLVKFMAGKVELTNKQAATFLDMLADVAVKETKKNGVFVMPGLGRLRRCSARLAWGATRRLAKRSKSRQRPWRNFMWRRLSRMPSPRRRNNRKLLSSKRGWRHTLAFSFVQRSTRSTARFFEPIQRWSPWPGRRQGIWRSRGRKAMCCTRHHFTKTVFGSNVNTFGREGD